MPQLPSHFIWRQDRVAKLMRDNHIDDRAQLALKISRPYSTVQRTISADWDGPVTSTAVLIAMAATFNVRMSYLVYEPKDMVKANNAA